MDKARTSPVSAQTPVLEKPEVEVDETSAIIDIVWRSGGESFSVVVTDNKMVGIACTVEPPRSSVEWTIDLPPGLLKIDHTALAKPGHAQCLDLEPVAYLHTLHMELGQTQRKLMWTEPSPFGIPGKHYSETYTVSCTPLYAQGPDTSTDRACTCHPSEAPVPCQKKYAYSECKAAAESSPDRPGK